MSNDNKNNLSRRDFIKTTGLAALATGIGGSIISPLAAKEISAKKKPRNASGGPYNILLIVTDQERYITPDELPKDYRLPGHERLSNEGIVFENHQIASAVCTPSRAVIYTGQHIQNNGMFDNTNFPWSGSLSPDIETLGDMLRKQGYYTAYKGKWHLAEEFETINDLHAPKKLLSEEMEAYGFSDYFGIGDVIGHTQGGYLHDDIISSMTKSWLRGKGEELREEKKPWFMSVNLVNPHDVMFYNTDLPGEKQQSKKTMMHLNRDPKNAQYQQQWNVKLPASRKQAIDEKGRPATHREFRDSRGMLVGVVPNEDKRWERLNNYYLNCLQDVDKNIDDILNELDELGITDNTIVIFTGDHGELAGAHGLNGKGGTAYREQNNVPFIISHPAYEGNKRCKAVTSHVDIATTLLSLAGADEASKKDLPGKDISSLLGSPEKALFNALREGALYNYNMFSLMDNDFLVDIGKFMAQGGKAEDLPKQGFKPNLNKRGAIRSIHDGRYKFNRYFAPLEHHVPDTMEKLFAYNDLELFDLKHDPLEMKNLALEPKKNEELIKMMNEKLNVLIADEVGDDIGQMLPKIKNADWTLAPSFDSIR